MNSPRLLPRTALLLLAVVLFPVLATAQVRMLPGFRTELHARVPGFISSLATDSTGRLYVSTTDGVIHRVDGNGAVQVATVPTSAGGNGGLLGIAILDDQTAVAHYTVWDETKTKVLDDVISRIDLTTGISVPIRIFQCDITKRENGASSEHHGGNLAVAPDGSIFVGIGEYGAYAIAQMPEWNAGKIWKMDRYGNATQWARGLRNPYDLAWDPELNAVVTSDNGPKAGDEMHVVPEGANLGWPNTFGNEPPMAGALVPNYVWPNTVAPTGLQRLGGQTPMLPKGYLSTAFVTRGLYWFPGITAAQNPAPLPIIELFPEFLIDVAEAPDGALYLGAAFSDLSGVYRLFPPERGDCDGNGRVEGRDVLALLDELRDGNDTPVADAHLGSHAGSFGCDADGDRLINASDLSSLRAMIVPSKRRAVR